LRRLHLCAVAVILVPLVSAAQSAGSSVEKRSSSKTVDALGPETRCPGRPAFRCATLGVPLDHSGRRPGALRLLVGFAGQRDPPRGYLLVLAGGPGQAAVPRLQRVSEKLRPLINDYRIVMVDQRGTGSRAIDCPALQRETGGSDILPPSPTSVRACAARIGPVRRYYSTADTVADLELLRRSLGQRTWAVDGTSYGTFVGARYALAHPKRVSRLVLDSVVPHDRFEPFLTAPLRATARVLRQLCAAEGCSWDPARELAAEVRTQRNGVQLHEALTVYGIVDPSYTGFLGYLHAAATGERAELDSFLATWAQAQRGTHAADTSAGLHAATACIDGRWPWGTSDTAESARRKRYRAAAEALPEKAVWPYDRATAAGIGWNLTCFWWPPTPTPPLARGKLRVPALLLSGANDLSTPVEWARREQQMAPRSRLVILEGAGHGSHLRASGNEGTKTVIAFLRGE
jgi:pimeloyl-ACP methyl ester carboxylesterase